MHKLLLLFNKGQAELKLVYWESSIIEQEQVIKSEPRHLFQAELGLEFSGNIWNRASV